MRLLAILATALLTTALIPGASASAETEAAATGPTFVDCGGGWHRIEWNPYFTTVCMNIPGVHACPGGYYAHGSTFVTTCIPGASVAFVDCGPSGWHRIQLTPSLTTVCMNIPGVHACSGGGYYAHGSTFITTCLP